MDKSNDFKKVVNHNFGGNFKCYCVAENRKNNKKVNYAHNG